MNWQKKNKIRDNKDYPERNYRREYNLYHRGSYDTGNNEINDEQGRYQRSFNDEERKFQESQRLYNSGNNFNDSERDFQSTKEHGWNRSEEGRYQKKYESNRNSPEAEQNQNSFQRFRDEQRWRQIDFENQRNYVERKPIRIWEKYGIRRSASRNAIEPIEYRRKERLDHNVTQQRRNKIRRDYRDEFEDR